MSVISRPCVWTLPSSLKTLYIDEFQTDQESQRQAVFQLISDAAQRGDNIGVDEFPTDFFELVLNFVDVAVTLSEPGQQPDHPSGRLLGLVVIIPSRFNRSFHRTACQLLIVTTPELAGRLIWRELTRLGVALATESRRYTACFVEVFVPCLERVLATRDEGFTIASCIPAAGLLAGHSGYIDNYIMYKALADPEIAVLTLADEMSIAPADDDEDDDTLKTFTLRELPDYLPCRYNLDNGQTQILVRPLRRDEVADFYAAIIEAAKSGKGYGYDELPSLAYFIRWYVDEKYNTVFELVTPGDKTSVANGNASFAGERGSDEKRVIIRYGNFGPSICSRSVNKSVLADGSVVFKPEFRRRGLTSVVLDVIGIGLYFDCGFKWLFGDTAMTNTPALLGMRRAGCMVCGSVPQSIYFNGLGWVDGIHLCMALDERHSLRRKLLESKI